MLVWWCCIAVGVFCGVGGLSVGFCDLGMGLLSGCVGFGVCWLCCLVACVGSFHMLVL